MEAQWVSEPAEERVEAIEPSRPPEAPPNFRATVRPERQGLAQLDRERPSSNFRQQDPVHRFSDAHSEGAIRASA